MEMLWGVLALSLVCGILLQFCPKSGTMLTYIQFLVSLVLLLMLLTPLVQMLANFRITDPTDLLLPADLVTDRGDCYENAVMEGTVARAEEALKALICAETGIGMEEMDAMMTTETHRDADGVQVTVTAVTVTLYRREHGIAAEKIAALTEKTLFCPCTVTVEEGAHA